MKKLINKTFNNVKVALVNQPFFVFRLFIAVLLTFVSN